MSHSLPQQANIDIAAFAKTLDKTDTSYKFLWLLAILEILKEREYNQEPILFRDIFLIMIRIAKEPINRFKLSFGARDQLPEYLKKLENFSSNHKINLDLESINPILDNPIFNKVCAELSLYVPYRWLRPFIEQETKGAGGITRNQKAINNRIVQIAVKKSKSKNPLPYFIEPNKNGGCIIINSLWADYLSKNLEVIKGWCLWNFANFLQVRNPNTPAIINKIITDENQTRRLAKQRDFWIDIFTQTKGMNCIYSGKCLSAESFALDHYVPWSFVGHNNMWNLIPACPSVNSSKSDNLPDNRYLDRLVNVHHNALLIREQNFPKKHKNLIESYIADLKLAQVDITNKTKLYDAYKMFMPPLIDLAKANRFNGDWVYNSKTPLLDKNGNFL